MSDRVFLLDTKGRIVSTTSGGGFALDPRAVQHVSRFYTPHEVESGVPAEVLADAVRNESVKEVVSSCESGSRCEIETIALRKANGAVMGFLRVVHDCQNEHLTVLAHELRDPLTAISLSTSSLASELGAACSKTARERMETILECTAQALRIVHDVVDGSLLDLGHLRIDLGPVDLVAIINESIRAVRPIAEKQAQQIEISVPDRLDVLSDRARTLQILANLLGNALKFTPRGGAISVRAWPRDDVGTVEVHDTGVGLSESEIPHVFDRYWKGDRLDRRGLGLGLFIAKRLAELQGGQLSVESAAGTGSTFVLSLRRSIDPAP